MASYYDGEPYYLVGALLDSESRVLGYKIYFAELDEVRTYSPITGAFIINRLLNESKIYAVGVSYFHINYVKNAVATDCGGNGYVSHKLNITATEKPLCILWRYTNELGATDKYVVLRGDGTHKEIMTQSQIDNLLDNGYYLQNSRSQANTLFESEFEGLQDKQLSDFKVKLRKNYLAVLIQENTRDFSRGLNKPLVDYTNVNNRGVKGYTYYTYYLDVDKGVAFKGKSCRDYSQFLKRKDVLCTRPHIAEDYFLLAVYRYKGLPLFMRVLVNRSDYYESRTDIQESYVDISLLKVKDDYNYCAGIKRLVEYVVSDSTDSNCATYDLEDLEDESIE